MNITDEAAYSSAAILKDLRTLIGSGQCEGQMIDYKAEISSKDNRPETVAAFANSIGGIIVFGIEGKGDQPRNLSNFDPKGVEVKTQLTSMIISRMQPRPSFQIRVLTLDTDTTKEVAILRVSEGGAHTVHGLERRPTTGLPAFGRTESGSRLPPTSSSFCERPQDVSVCFLSLTMAGMEG